MKVKSPRVPTSSCELQPISCVESLEWLNGTFDVILKRNTTRKLLRHYGVTILCLQFAVPFTVIAYCYARIGCFLHGKQQSMLARTAAQIRRTRQRVGDVQKVLGLGGLNKWVADGCVTCPTRQAKRMRIVCSS
jgi:hypothetical protein